jgi:hypothetical protein
MFVLIALGAWQVSSTSDFSSRKLDLRAEQCTALLTPDLTFTVILQAEVPDRLRTFGLQHELHPPLPRICCHYETTICYERHDQALDNFSSCFALLRCRNCGSYLDVDGREVFSISRKRGVRYRRFYYFRDTTLVFRPRHVQSMSHVCD